MPALINFIDSLLDVVSACLHEAEWNYATRLFYIAQFLKFKIYRIIELYR